MFPKGDFCFCPLPTVKLCGPIGDLDLQKGIVSVRKRSDNSGGCLLPSGNDLTVSLTIAISILHTKEIILPYSEECTEEISLYFFYFYKREKEQWVQNDTPNFIQEQLRYEAILQLLLSLTRILLQW